MIILRTSLLLCGLRILQSYAVTVFIYIRIVLFIPQHSIYQYCLCLNQELLLFNSLITVHVQIHAREIDIKQFPSFHQAA